MSVAPWQSRASVPPLLRPEAVIGAASPLWGYFTGAALAGMGWWWMTHWATRPAGLEAVARLEAAADAVVEPAATAMAEVLEPAATAVAEALGGPVGEALAADETPALPVGGEAAPFGPATLEAAVISEPELAKDLKPTPAPPPPKAEAASEPEVAPEPEAAKQPKPAPAPRSRKTREGEPKPH